MLNQIVQRMLSPRLNAMTTRTCRLAGLMVLCGSMHIGSVAAAEPFPDQPERSMQRPALPVITPRGWHPAAQANVPPTGLNRAEADDALDQLQEQLGAADPRVRKSAAMQIGWYGVQAAPVLPDLCRLLRDGNRDVRHAARQTLTGFLQSGNPALSRVTAYILGTTGCDAAEFLSELRRLLDVHQGPARLQFAEAIARINPDDVAAIDTLTAALDDSNVPVRRQAAFALDSASPRHIARIEEPLREALGDSDALVRLAAASTLNTFPRQNAAPIIRLAYTTRAAADRHTRTLPHRSVDANVPRELTTTAARLFPGRRSTFREALPPPSDGHPPRPRIFIEPMPHEWPAAVPAPPVSLTSLDGKGALARYELMRQQDEPAMTTPERGAERAGIFKIEESLVHFSRAIPLDEDGKRQPLPEDDPATAAEYAQARIDAGQMSESIYYPVGAGRGWIPQAYYWEAAALCHRPLYFEEINAERYGNSFVLVQPLVSAAHFFGTVPLLPYEMTVRNPHECTYTLGHYRPGSDIPFRHHRLPLRLDGSLMEAATIWGAALLIH